MYKKLAIILTALFSTTVFAKGSPHITTPDAKLYVEATKCRLVTTNADVQGPCKVFVEANLLEVKQPQSSEVQPDYLFTDQAKAAGSGISQVFSKALRASFKKPEPVLEKEQPSTNESGEPDVSDKVSEVLL